MAFSNPLMKLSFETRGWINLFSGFALHFILGTFYLWGSISTYTTSYLRQDGQAYTKEDVGAVFPFTFLAINVGTPFGVYIAQRIGFRITIFIGSILIGLATIISSFVIDIFPLFVLFYGVIFGLLNGLLYMVPFNTCYQYMPHRKGLVSGVIAGGFGFGSTAFIWLMYGIVNPDNEKPTDIIDGTKYFRKEVCDNYPEALRVLGIVQMVIGVFSGIIHQIPSQEDLKQQELKNSQNKQTTTAIKNDKEYNMAHGSEKNSSSDNQVQDKPTASDIERVAITETALVQVEADQNCPPNREQRKSYAVELQTVVAMPQQQVAIKQLPDSKKPQEEVYFEFQTFKDGLKTKFIYISIAFAMMCTLYGTMIVSNYKLYGEYNNYDDSFLSTVGTIGSIFNGCSRIFWGSLMEKFTIKQILTANLLIQIVVSFTFRWVASISPLFFIYTILGYFVYGGWLSVLPTLIVRIYGKQIGTRIYGITFFGFALASFIQYFLVKEIKNAIDWGYTFWVFTGVQIIALISGHIVRFNAVPPTAKQEVKSIQPVAAAASA